MSYSQRQREGTNPNTAPCQYKRWWRERRLRSDRQRGRSPVKWATIPSSNAPTPIFDPNEFRLTEPSRRIIDLEKGLQYRHSQSSLGSCVSSASFSSTTALVEKRSTPSSEALPSIGSSRIIRCLWYGLFAAYQRLFTLVFAINFAAVLILLHCTSWNTSTAFDLDNLAALASSNLLVAVLFRQDWLINLLFRTAWLIPWSLPLRVRRAVSRVYCYGGIHSGAAVMGTVWWVVFTVVLSWESVDRGSYTPVILVSTLVILSLLVTMAVMSLPQLRVRHHDSWELTHRFLGWSSIALFWAQILSLTNYKSTPALSFADSLARNPSFYTLIAITLLLIYPWLLLRRWTFTAMPLSSHALQLSFPNKVHKYSCLVLSSSPLREWHPFATFPNIQPDEEGQREGSSLVISAAGDWTKQLIAAAQAEGAKHKEQAPAHTHTQPVQMRFWVKSHPRAGVLSLSCLYKRVLVVTTGSGIGPSLSSLLDRPPNQTARLVWSTRSPRKTYGDGIMRLVHRADAHALILDTDEMGRPDLLSVAWRMYAEMDAEAVFVLSNEKVTRMVVGGLEKRGVPAYGPIWDS